MEVEFDECVFVTQPVTQTACKEYKLICKRGSFCSTQTLGRIPYHM